MKLLHRKYQKEKKSFLAKVTIVQNNEHNNNKGNHGDSNNHTHCNKNCRQ